MPVKDVSRLIHEVHVKDPKRDQLTTDQIDALEANARLFVERPGAYHLAHVGAKWVTDFDEHGLPHPATLA